MSIENELFNRQNIHTISLFVANNLQAAKIAAKRKWTNHLDKIHTDNCINLSNEIFIDNINCIQHNKFWYPHLTQMDSQIEYIEKPDWYGYWRL